MTDLPPGFELDQPAGPAPLPPGFEIDGAPAAQAPPAVLPPGPFTMRAPDGRLITRPPTPQEVKPFNLGQAINSGLAGALDMATFNQFGKLTDKINALTGNPAGVGDYVRERDAAKAGAPGAYAVGGLAGAAANPAIKGLGVVADAALPTTGTGAVGVLARYANRIGQGAAIGAGYGAGFAPDGEAGQGAKSGAIGGALTGGALQLGADTLGAIGAGAKALTASSDAKVMEQKFKDMAQAGYKQAEDAGVVISPDTFKKFVDELPTQLKGYDEDVTDQPAKLVRMLQKKANGEPLTLETLDKARSVASGMSASQNLNDARIAGDITHKIDQFVDDLAADNLMTTGANTANAADALKRARSDWRTYSKLRTVNDIVDTGEILNDQNWVKGRFRALVKSSQFDRFSQEEQQAIASVARTGNLEKATKLIPWRGIQMATTYAEPFAQQAKINSLQDLIAQGGSRLKPPPKPPALLSPPYLSAYGGLLGSSVLSRGPTNGR